MRSARLWIALTALSLLVSACEDDLTTINKDGAVADARAEDATPGDTSVDVATPDGPVVTPDGPQPTPDAPLPAPDTLPPSPDAPPPTLDTLPPSPDVQPPKPDAQPPKPDGGPPPGGCFDDKDCKVFNDCCDCEAIPVKVNKPNCKKLCVISTCQSLGFKLPEAYCAGGRCLITDRGTSCKTDKDCKQVDNCCDCLALPVGVSAPVCNINSCFVSTCTALGLTKLQPRCANGTCRLAL